MDGTTDEEIVALLNYQNYDDFDERQKAVFTLTEQLTRDIAQTELADSFRGVDEDTQAAIKAHFSEAEIVELTAGICLFNFLNRFNRFTDPELDMEEPPPEIRALVGK